jgi:hypothetical protein
MTDEPVPDAARRIDRPATGPEKRPYDEEMTEPDEANAPDVREQKPSGDEELGTPDERR